VIAAAVFSGFAASLVAPLLYRLLRSFTGWVLALLPLGLFIYFASLAGLLSEGETVSTSYTWVPSLGIQLSFYLDGLSSLFAMLISGIGVLVIIYGGGYLAGHAHLGRFYLLILFFMASMLGVVLADNLFTLFVFWELTSLSSYLLIGFEHERDEARKAALQALLVTGSAGLAMLAGLVLLSMAGGTPQISALLTQGDLVRGSSLYLPALALILLGAFAKSAQFPFHFWLPGAMEAPTPVSAYLHSATMVKAGIYLLARLSPVLGGTEAWLYSVSLVGTVTLLVGGFLALYHTNMKRILAYSTISALGTIVLLIGFGSSGAIKAAIVFLLAHALYKGALFMLAGAIYHETGTQDVDELGGLRRSMPILAGVTILAAISLSGLGPVLSFIGKELFFEAVLESHELAFLFVPAAVLGSAVSVAVALILVLRVFFGPLKHTPKHPHDAPLSLWLGPAVLGLLGLLIGLFPVITSRTIIAPAVQAVYGEPVSVVLALYHGLNHALLLSAVAITLGFVLYFLWDRLRLASHGFERLLRWGPHSLYNASMDWMNALAAWQTRVLQSGKLHNYMVTIVLTTVVMVGMTFFIRGGDLPSIGLPVIRYYEVGLMLLMLAAILIAVTTTSRLTAVASLGVVGYGVSLIFVFYGAPDLAMTQVLIETMTVILMVLVLYHLPRFSRFTSTAKRTVDAVIAIAAGVMMTFLVLIATSVQEFPPISSYFTEHAVDMAHGRNIVNVILVDFRALDTLGEITVLSLAGIGVYALLKLRMHRKQGE
jgi:multicomponent Na+:H+ antiporter subunit A